MLPDVAWCQVQLVLDWVNVDDYNDNNDNDNNDKNNLNRTDT